METLAVVAHHRNQYYSRSRAHGPARFGSFGSPRSSGFRDINCRTFQSGAGVLPTPLKASTAPVTKQASSCSSSPETSSPSVNSHHSEESKHLKKTANNSIVPIPVNITADPNNEGLFNDEFTFFELWAGPAYSNSPPPSSLPIPKFSLCPTERTVSLNLPALSASDINFHPIAKSAPSSPTRDHGNFSSKDLFHSADSATKTLRRILNLDIADD